MIQTKNCTACGICGIICPRKAINFSIKKGFPVPEVNRALCIHCGKCDEYCTKDKKIVPADKCSYYAAWSNDEKGRKASASGGIAYEIAKLYVERGYRFIGVRMNLNELCAETYYCDTVVELEASRGSKYITSHPLPGLCAVAKDDKPFIMIGTPCQIVAVDHYLRKVHRRDRALLVDLLCAGPATELLLQKYVDEKVTLAGKSKDDVESVHFRDKTEFGWSATMRIQLKDGTGLMGEESHWADGFFSIFFSRACQKDACYRCLLECTRTAADIRLSDFWGEKYKENKSGVSAVIAASENGAGAIRDLSKRITLESVTSEEIFARQLSKPQRKPFQRVLIMKQLEKGVSLEKIRLRYVRPIVVERIFRKKLIKLTRNSRYSAIRRLSESIRT